MKPLIKDNTIITEKKRKVYKGNGMKFIAGVIKVSPESLKDFYEIEYDHLKELSKKKIY